MNNKFVRYRDLLTITQYDEYTNKEEFVFLPNEGDIVFGKYEANCNMLKYGAKVPVRITIYEKLINVGKKLKEINKEYKLCIVYGFRALEIQNSYFYEILEEIKDKFNNELDLYEYIHEKVAVPSVAGHPTGGAVDIMIVDAKNSSLDFGSKILDWNNEKCYYENELLGKVARENRRLLRNLMMYEGFAPFDGEWWHFSYGDKEWAFYYGKEEALYNQMNAEDVYKLKQSK